MSRTGGLLLLASTLIAAPLAAQAPTVQRQTQADDYTSYELLAPERQQFRILYDVTATTAGATVFLNPIRQGSEASDERVIDLATGLPLPFTVITGREARDLGLPAAPLDAQYLRVDLHKPVPADGEQRIRIDKTYRDPASYTRDGTDIAFARSLGIRRNKIVLPPNYELVSCNTPAQVFTEDDGRVAVSFVNVQPGQVALELRARPLPVSATRGRAVRATAALSAAAHATAPMTVRVPTLEESAVERVADRAFQDREITYWLQAPDTHAFDIAHDYTETRVGTDRYVNVVRGGSRASNPGAKVLDTGAVLPVEVLRGEAITRAGIDIGAPVTAESEIVLVRFPPVKAGQGTRLRITETYTDPSRYGIVDGALVWRRGFGRPRNVVILPEGWYLTASSVPATIDRDDSGRVRLTVRQPEERRDRRPDSRAPPVGRTLGCLGLQSRVSPRQERATGVQSPRGGGPSMRALVAGVFGRVVTRKRPCAISGVTALRSGESTAPRVGTRSRTPPHRAPARWSGSRTACRRPGRSCTRRRVPAHRAATDSPAAS